MSEPVYRMATQCTVNGRTGSFLFQGDSADLNHRFVGPYDERKLVSPVYADTLDLHAWARANGNPLIAGMATTYRIWLEESL